MENESIKTEEVEDTVSSLPQPQYSTVSPKIPRESVFSYISSKTLVDENASFSQINYNRRPNERNNENNEFTRVDYSKFTNIFSGLAIPFMTYITGNIFNIFTEKQIGIITNETFDNKVMFLVKQFALLGLIDFFTIWAMTSIWSWTGERQARRMREVYFNSLLKMKINYFEQTEITSGGILTNVNKDSDSVHRAISENIGRIIQYTVTVVGCMAFAFGIHAILTLVILSTLPLVFLTMAITNRIANPLLSKEREIFIKAGNVLENALNVIKTIKAFNSEEKEEKIHLEHLNSANIVSKKLALTYAICTGIIQFLLLSLFVQGFWYGSVLVANKKLNAGDVINVFFATLMGASVLKGILPNFVAIAKAKVAIKSINILLEKVALLESEALRGFKLSGMIGDIEFQEVNFSYPSRQDTLVLKNVNLFIPAGQTTVLVGQSGSGKSTISQLIQRLYEPDSGLITIDGRELKILNISWLRQQIGIVSQEPVLFDDTIFANVAYGKVDYENVTLDEVIEACKLACIHEFIMELPEKYDTQLGDKGAKLSGGQRQRLVIARALIKDPTILILDEASSALDMESDLLVQKALQNCRVGRTTIVITHNMSHISKSDRVYLLSEGEVVEGGTILQLLEDPDGHYSKLVEATRKEINPKRKTIELDAINLRLRKSDKNLKPYMEYDDVKTADILNGSASVAITKRYEKRVSYYEIFNYYDYENIENEIGRNSRNLIDILVTTSDDESMKKGQKRKSVIELVKNTLDQRFIYSLGLFASIINGLMMPIFSYVVARLLSTYSITNKDELLKQARFFALIVIAIAIINGLSAHYKYYFLERASELWSTKLRHLGFGKILRQPQSWFDKSENAVGLIATILITDTSTTKNLIGHFLGNLTVGIIALVGGIVWAFFIGWELTLVGCALAPILVLTTEIQGYILQRYEKKQKHASEAAANSFYQTISSIRTVFALAVENVMTVKFQTALVIPYKIGIKKAFISGFIAGLLDAFLFFSKALTFWYGAKLVSQGSYDLQKMVTVWSLIIFCTSAASQMLSESIALVGKSGNGKSTVATLLQRFYEPTNGEILLDDVKFKDLKLQWLREQIGIVSQEPILFDNTVSENIAYGKSNSTQEEIELAAQQVNMHDFIKSLPKGYNTHLGSSGSQLSGGQKQRISIARVLIRNPKILILDEATSALDTENEKIVNETLKKVQKGRTTLVITHRLNNVQNMDKIALVEDGKVSEFGTHQELMRNKSGYFKLFVSGNN
ncbi:1771_t:CDS:2 [Diversispora eburnea]|uniref:1771_t:CDS:1 n=1 Tax=Diversispora eburnea TaxID=1213867 RepID=A0A9N8UZZ1_9GLOM|nr:1771_t:CDS:2 [Diversispora eburnea]